MRGSVEIRLRVTEAPEYLRQEMTISVDIETARRADTLIVPNEAIRDAGNNQAWVLVVREGTAQRQAVKLGSRSEGRTEILEGLAPGDLLVPVKNLSIREGSRVRAGAVQA